MFAAVIDTHAILWFLYRAPSLSQKARGFIIRATENGDNIGISTITLVEILYLSEKGNIAAEAPQRVQNTLDDNESIFVEVPVDRSIIQAMPRIPRAAVPDMPDRIIAATALHLDVPLISRDAKIQASGLTTVW